MAMNYEFFYAHAGVDPMSKITQVLKALFI